MKGLDTVRARYAGKASQEWERLTTTPIRRIEYLITSHWLQRYLPRCCSWDAGRRLRPVLGPGVSCPRKEIWRRCPTKTTHSML